MTASKHKKAKALKLRAKAHDIFGNDVLPDINPDINPDITDVNYQGKWGYTALHFAVVEENVEGVKTLLKRKANPHIKNNSKKTPYDMAKSRASTKDATESSKIILDLLTKYLNKQTVTANK